MNNYSKDIIATFYIRRFLPNKKMEEILSDIVIVRDCRYDGVNLPDVVKEEVDKLDYPVLITNSADSDIVHVDKSLT